MADKAKQESFFAGLKNLIVEHFSEKESKKFAEAKTKDGATVTYDGEMPMEGMPIFVIPSDGTDPIPPADGVLVLEDGHELEVKGGVITAVKMPAGAPAPAAGEMGTPVPVSQTEAAAKKVIESTIKETVFSKQEVSDLLEKQKTEFTAQLKEVSEKFDAVQSANEVLTKEIGKVSATNADLIQSTEKLTNFSKQLPELLKEFGAEPQTQETEEEKKKRLEAFNTDKPKTLTDKEWKDKFMKR